jgi:UDP-N-acetylglucosamine acyltransferase
MQNSTIHPKAKIGNNVKIEPYSFISENVEIGEGTWIGPHVTIFDYVKIGKNCKIFPGAVIGAIPQDLKFDGEVTYVEIGDNTVIRECATINRGTAASGKGKTVVGSNCLLMSYTHVAHDCRLGDHVIMVSYVGIAGETDVDDWAIIGGSSVAHQFSKIGAHAMVSGGSLISKDIPPYALAGRRPISFCGINIVGLRRRGFTNEQIERIKDIYKVLYSSGMNRTDACNALDEKYPDSPEKDIIVNFVRNSKRGIIKFSHEPLDEE